MRYWRSTCYRSGRCMRRCGVRRAVVASAPERRQPRRVELKASALNRGDAMEPPPQRKRLSASGGPLLGHRCRDLRKIEVPGTSGKEPGTAADLVAMGG
eukprot:scaffold14588_cov59-Phaeocystis_antarctica.AAC.4